MNDHPTPPSWEFIHHFLIAEDDEKVCGFCDRLNFYTKSGKGVRVPLGMQVVYRDKPVKWGSLAGKVVVEGCPCNRARHYEDLFWEHRGEILCFIGWKLGLEVPGAEHGQPN